jgi:hypothetical protein
MSASASSTANVSEVALTDSSAFSSNQTTTAGSNDNEGKTSSTSPSDGDANGNTAPSAPVETDSRIQIDDDVTGDLKKGKQAKRHELCISCGHAWHWIEIFLILNSIFGLVIIIIDNPATSEYAGRSLSAPVPPIIIAICAGACVMISGGFIWNYCTAKRLSMASNSLLQTVKEISEQNKIAKETYLKMKGNNVEMEDRLHQLREARMLVGKSVISIDAISKKQGSMLEQTDAIMEKRKKFHKVIC